MDGRVRTLLDVLDRLYNIQTRGTRSSHVDNDRPDQGARSEILDLFRHGGGKEEGLSLGREKGHDLADILVKALSARETGLEIRRAYQVDHSVSFIQTQVVAHV